MKKFKFRLEKVLQFRRAIQDEKRREFTLAMRKLKEAEETLRFLEREFENNKIRDAEVLTLEELQLRSAYSERLKREIANQKETISRCQEEVEIARQAYIDATKDAEVLEKLKDRKRTAYNEMVAKQEEAFLDELVTQRARFHSVPKG